MMMIETSTAVVLGEPIIIKVTIITVTVVMVTVVTVRVVIVRVVTSGGVVELLVSFRRYKTI